MAVTITTEIYKFYTWGSYDYATWGGSEDITWGNAGLFNTNLLATEQFVLGDKHTESYGKLNTEQFVLSDKWMGSYDRLYKERFVLRDKCTKSYGKLGKERFTLMDEHTKLYDKLDKEQLALSDKCIGNILKTFTEDIRTDESFLRNFNVGLFFCEDVYIDEFNSKNQLKPFNEDIAGLEDGYTNNFNLIPIESFNVVDAIDKTFATSWDEDIPISELLQKQIVLPHKEGVIGIKDTILQASGSVMSNIYITEGAYNIEQFSDVIDIPPGYTKFTDFKVGEYEYQEALVRISLSAVNQSQPTASGITMHVDIPDTDDRGTATITNTSSPTKVYLNKHFYIDPEVQVTLKNGNIGSGFITPNIVSVDGQDEYGRYFTVELRTSSGARTTGTISWVAKGY